MKTAITASLSALAPDGAAAPRRAALRRRPALKRVVLHGLMVSLMLFPVAANAAAAQGGFADLAERLLPSVVTIRAVRVAAEGEDNVAPGPFGLPFTPDGPFGDFLERFRRGGGGNNGGGQPEQKRIAAGSGFFIDKGVIVTNNHVVENSEEIMVSFNGEQQEYTARLVGADPGSDIAVLTVETDRKMKTVSFGDSSRVRVGDQVLAVGNPWGLGGSVTAGIVSAIGRDINRESFVDFIQTDAAINQGNSGGPLFNMDGEVIGINTAIYSRSGGSIGIGFSIPSNDAAQIVAELRQNGRVDRGWLGVSIQPVTPDIAEGVGLDAPRGAMVSRVYPDTPAAAAGLVDGDIILELNRTPVRDAAALRRAVAAAGAGESVKITVWRDGRERTMTVKLGKREEEKVANLDGAPAPSSGDAPVAAFPELGLRLSPVTDELRQRFDLPAETEGLVVTGLLKDGDAARKGVRPGMLLVGVARKPVKTIQEFRNSLDQLRRDGREVALLRLLTPEGPRFVAVRLAQG